MKRQRIVLDIVYDDTLNHGDDPAYWDWDAILDGHDLHGVRVVAETECIDIVPPSVFDSETPHFDQKHAPLLLGTVGVLQRIVGTEDQYVMHGKSVRVIPAGIALGAILIERSIPDEVVVSFVNDDGVKMLETPYKL